jgi:aspartyl-tRNA(Asn)/glutamyl-tRNA(Gln) amidotransferase subunit A
VILGLDRAAEPWAFDAAFQGQACLPDVTPSDDPGGVTQLLAGFASGAITPSGIVAGLRAKADPMYLWQMLPADTFEADRRWQQGTARPLEGVPFAVKAIIDVAGAEVTCGSWATGARIAARDALAVARLRAAGAVPFAMAATTEYAAGSPHNPRHGTVCNPWDATRWTGGSSTGSGGALAAGLVPLALGTDTGGSIRVPSAWCGVTGLKPTRGLCPLEGVATLSWTLDHLGPMARSAADLVTALGVMAGGLGTDAPRLARIGVPQGWFDDSCDAAVLAAHRAALAQMEAAGLTLVPFDVAAHLGDLAAAHQAAWDILLTELAATQARNLVLRDRQDKGLQARIAQGETVSGRAYAAALSLRSVMLARFLALFDALDLDILMTPGLGAEAGDLASLTAEVNGTAMKFQDIIPRNTILFDLTGLPALMLPAGLGPHGLPLGVQIVGRPYGDGTCLAAGMLFQSLTSHHLNRPK